MSFIDRAATFRGNIVDHAVNVSTGGFPQFQVQLIANEIWDIDEEKWADWTPYEEREITAYLILFGGKGETFNVQHIKEATGWDGNSFQQLNDADLSKVTLQFRVETNTYEGKDRLQVARIAAADAIPGRSVKKLDASELKRMDAQYARFLKNSGTKAAPTKKATKPAGPSKVTKKGVEPTQAKGPVKKKKSNDPLGPDAAPPPPEQTAPIPAPPDPALPTGHCTKDEAWAAAYTLKAKKYDDGKIATVWRGAMKKVAPGVEQDAFTDEQWFLVKELVLDETAAF